MKWINATHLEQWSHRTDARALLIDMVGDLIRAAAPNAAHFRFPGGDKAQVRGFDGDLQINCALPPFIPGGESKWEFGITAGISKANSDYQKRTADVAQAERQENTLVIVNLHTWDTPQTKIVDWLKKKNDAKEWKDVCYIDGSQLETWLDAHPAVAARYARNVLQTVPQVGAQSIDEFWDIYSSKFKPKLTEQVLLCDREEQVTSLLHKLGGNAEAFMLGAESAKDVIAFAVAAIRTAETTIRQRFESKTMIVESQEAARFLATKNGLVFLTLDAADASAGYLGQRGPTLSAAIGIQARKAEMLPRPSASALGKALITMGYTAEDGYKKAKECGRSITILQRLIPSCPIEEPQWLPHQTALLPAILAGGWSTNSDLDKKLLAMLSAKPSYYDFEAEVRKTITLPDPPLDHINDVWKIRSPVDAFPYFGHLIGEPELERFKNAAITVFGHVIQQPAAEDRFKFNPNPPQEYSSWLRDGLAETLLQFATLADQANLTIPNKTPQQFVNEILLSLPEWGKSHHILNALSDQLTTLAEAAPQPFLSAIELMLDGDQTEIKQIFSERTDIFSPTSCHVYVLWALERLAWDRHLLLRVSIILTKLAKIDKDGNGGNRPIDTLRTIFLSWAPCTYATLKQRLACIDAIIKCDDVIGWILLTYLLPGSTSYTTSTTKPKLRDVTPKEPEVITHGLVRESNSQIISRILQTVNGKQTRLLELIPRFADFKPAEREAALLLVDDYLTEHNTPEGNPVWFALNEELNKHHSFAESAWAITGKALLPISTLVEKHQPQDLVIQMKPLFADFVQNAGMKTAGTEQEVMQMRCTALAEIKKQYGLLGIIRLAESVHFSYSMAQTLEISIKKITELMPLFTKSFAKGKPFEQFTSVLSCIGVNKFGIKWTNFLRGHIKTTNCSATLTAKMLMNWPFVPTTWETVASFGVEVENSYWENIHSHPRKDEPTELLYVLEKYLTAGRAIHAFAVIHNRLTELPISLILRILDEGILELNGNTQNYNNMIQYYLIHIFENLPNQNDVSLENIARREFAYFSILKHGKKSFILHDFMAKNPEFYFEIFANVFKGEDEEPSELSDAARVLSHNCYSILASFRTIPGKTATTIDVEILMAWILAVQQLAMATKRSEISNQYIGHLLAYAPTDPDDQHWPHESIRLVIEKTQCAEIETGLAIERHNMRGVTCKAVDEGGQQERVLASQYNKWAEALYAYPRTASMLQAIADSWMREATQNDDLAEQGKLIR